MYSDNPTWVVRQRRRWLRPDAERYERPDAARWVKPELSYAIGPACARKYSPEQPRVPAGNPDGGQWTDAEGGGDSTFETILAAAKKLAAHSYSTDYLRCLDLCYPLLERPRTSILDANEIAFHRCMKTCMGNR